MHCPLLASYVQSTEAPFLRHYELVLLAWSVNKRGIIRSWLPKLPLIVTVRLQDVSDPDTITLYIKAFP
jgi:hypothetical protein